MITVRRGVHLCSVNAIALVVYGFVYRFGWKLRIEGRERTVGIDAARIAPPERLAMEFVQLLFLQTLPVNVFPRIEVIVADALRFRLSASLHLRKVGEVLCRIGREERIVRLVDATIAAAPTIRFQLIQLPIQSRLVGVEFVIVDEAEIFVADHHIDLLQTHQRRGPFWVLVRLSLGGRDAERALER